MKTVKCKRDVGIAELKGGKQGRDDNVQYTTPH